MKKSKVVEIDVCGSCGAETRPSVCVRCGKECCHHCASTLRVTATRWTPVQYGASGTHVYQYTSGYFCTACDGNVVSVLKSLELKAAPEAAINNGYTVD